MNLAVLICVLLLSTVIVRVAASIARKRQLLDIPNERSSHTVPVPRLGGAAFIPMVFGGVAVLLGGEWSAGTVSLVVGSVAIYLISLADDFVTLHASVRFAAHAAVALALLYAVRSELSQLGILPAWFVAIGLVFWLVGSINAYNFMDGIDGIAGVQAVVAAGFWGWIGVQHGAEAVSALGLCTVAGAVGFLTYNWPPARIFMGDAGSTVLGLICAGLPLLFLAETDYASGFAAVFAGFLVLWPFVIDASVTFLCRLRRRENVFQAHRSHLYQRMVRSGLSHQTVTLTYGGLAALGAVLAWLVLTYGPIAFIPSAAIIAACFFALWRRQAAVEKAGRGDL